MTNKANSPRTKICRVCSRRRGKAQEIASDDYVHNILWGAEISSAIYTDFGKYRAREYYLCFFEFFCHIALKLFDRSEADLL